MVLRPCPEHVSSLRLALAGLFLFLDHAIASPSRHPFLRRCLLLASCRNLSERRLPATQVSLETAKKRTQSSSAAARGGRSSSSSSNLDAAGRLTSWLQELATDANVTVSRPPMPSRREATSPDQIRARVLPRAAWRAVDGRGRSCPSTPSTRSTSLPILPN